MRPLPFRASFYGFGLCQQGTIRLQANLDAHTIAPHTLLLLGPEVVRQWENQSADYNIKALFFTEDFFLQDKAMRTLPQQFGFLHPNAIYVLPLPAEEAGYVWRLLQAISQVLAGASPRKADIVRSYLGVLLNAAADYHEQYTTGAARPEPLLNLVGRFQRLVAAEHPCRRPVGAYADLLCVAPKHLSETVKRDTGKTASEWIADRVLLEARIELRQTSLSISQIAKSLRFSDVSAFVKFFRRQSGLTPAAYRRQQ
ncbi:MAG: helix-turn-helix domain-containing protein [Hymenobacter sp.]